MLRAAHHREARMFVTLVYSIPDWLLCIIVIALVSVVAMAGLWLVHRRLPTEARRPHNEIAGFLINAIGVIFAVILAFIAVAVWESAGKAQDIVAAEANEATDILRNAAVYPEPLARRVLTVLTVVSCYFVGSDGIRVQMTLTGFVGASIGAMLAFIIAMDYPFRGSVSVDPVPFQRVLDDLERADTRARS